MEIPAGMAQKIVFLSNEILSWSHLPCRHLESLLGLLNFAAPGSSGSSQAETFDHMGEPSQFVDEGWAQTEEQLGLGNMYSRSSA